MDRNASKPTAPVRWPLFTQLRLAPDYLELVRSGAKKSTVRRGYMFPAAEELLLISGERTLRVRLLGVDYRKTLRTLTESDAQMDGFPAKLQLVGALKRFYPDLAEDEPLSIVYFDVVE